MKKIIIMLLLSLMSTASYAFLGITGASIGYGRGDRDDIQGIRASVQWDWHKVWFAEHAINLTGYWDLSATQFYTRGDQQGNHKYNTSFAIAPIFRIQPNSKYTPIFNPYLEASVGLAVHTQRKFALVNQGSIFAFQDLLGFGVEIGEKRKIDVSFHVLHYSNANLFPPNNGITLQTMFSFTYHFD
ncbi:MAG: acyloxyacyl hydrolase [Proteobacteria bacterium]|nr:acyloxyacyl hydrolase [Pseudomonadota bacterium]